MAQQSQQPPSELHIREAHGAIMTSTFVVLMPLGALLVYLPAGAKTIPYIHAPFQVYTVCLAIAGLVLGVLLCSPDEYRGISTHDRLRDCRLDRPFAAFSGIAAKSAIPKERQEDCPRQHASMARTMMHHLSWE
jgi:hypothetical protein